MDSIPAKKQPLSRRQVLRRSALGLGAAALAYTGSWFAYEHFTARQPQWYQVLDEQGEHVGWSTAPPDPHRPRALLESASEVGINWKMNLLPREQGEDFKINLYDHGCGLAVGDYNNDGFDDIYFCNELGPNALYRNRGDGTFEEVAQQAGVALDDRVCVAAAFVDYDNNGLLDLFVTSTRGGNVLFKNLGNGKFQDVTAAAGLQHHGHSQSALFFDYNNDGYLDLLLTNTAHWTTDDYDKASRAYRGGGFAGLLFRQKEANILYRNNGDGTFTDVTKASGLQGRGWAGDAVAFDYDNDGKIDVFITSMFGRAQLYHNNGDGTFTDVTLKVLGRTPYGGVGAKVFDFNNDGLLDLLVVDMHSDMWMGLDYQWSTLNDAKKYEKTKFPSSAGPTPLTEQERIKRETMMADKLGLRAEELLFGNAFYRNEGNGKFSEISDQANLETLWPWSIATGDFDNDGFEDVFMASGMGYPFYYWPNCLLMNQGDETFRDQARELGVEPPRRGEYFSDPMDDHKAARSSRCVVTGDFDGDGRLEIVVNNFNDQPYYFKNTLPRRNYIAFRLRGRGGPTGSNLDAIGAVVRLRQHGMTLTRLIAGSAGYLSQSSNMVHFGLGDDPNVEWVEITWPRSGKVQRIEKLEVNKLHTIKE